eukprot:10792263-Alexandrium_andersonii.AAC.1
MRLAGAGAAPESGWSAAPHLCLRSPRPSGPGAFFPAGPEPPAGRLAHPKVSRCACHLRSSIGRQGKQRGGAMATTLVSPSRDGEQEVRRGKLHCGDTGGHRLSRTPNPPTGPI